MVETIRNELRKTEKEEEIPHQDKINLKRKTKKKKSFYGRKRKRTSIRLNEKIKKEQKEETDVITIDAITANQDVKKRHKSTTSSVSDIVIAEGKECLRGIPRIALVLQGGGSVLTERGCRKSGSFFKVWGNYNVVCAP